MSEENQAFQSRKPMTATPVFAVVAAITALVLWYLYSIEVDRNQSLASENTAYARQVLELEQRVLELTSQQQNVSESLAQSHRKAGELETAAQQLTQAKTTLEASLAEEKQTRQQVEDALARERDTAAGIQRELAGLESNYIELEQQLAGLRSNYGALEQELARRRAEHENLEDRIAATDSEKQQLRARLEQATDQRQQVVQQLQQATDQGQQLQQQLEQAASQRQQLRQQIELASGDVAAREAELAAARQGIEQLDRELAQVRQERGELEARVAQLDAEQEEEAQHFAALKRRLERELNESRVQIRQLKNRLTVITMTDDVLFASGSAVIKPAGREVLSVIASSLSAYPDRIVSVEGHTDNEPLAKGAFYKSNWELSAARALSAVDYLRRGDRVAPARLRVVGHGEYSPVASNDSPEGRRLNRRIEILLLPPDGSGSLNADS